MEYNIIDIFPDVQLVYESSDNAGLSEAYTVKNKNISVEVDDSAVRSKSGAIIGRVIGEYGIVGKPNYNKRIYTKEFWQKVLERPDTKKRIERRALFGSTRHGDKLFPANEEISHITTKLWLPENKEHAIEGESELIGTPLGKIMSILFEAKAGVGISSRGVGRLIKRGSFMYPDPNLYILGGFDFVTNPSSPNAFPEHLKESVEDKLLYMLPELEKAKEFYNNILESIGYTVDKLESIYKKVYNIGTYVKESGEMMNNSEQSPNIAQPVNESDNTIDSIVNRYEDMLQEKEDTIKLLKERIRELMDGDSEEVNEKVISTRGVKYDTDADLTKNEDEPEDEDDFVTEEDDETDDESIEEATKKYKNKKKVKDEEDEDEEDESEEDEDEEDEDEDEEELEESIITIDGVYEDLKWLEYKRNESEKKLNEALTRLSTLENKLNEYKKELNEKEEVISRLREQLTESQKTISEMGNDRQMIEEEYKEHLFEAVESVKETYKTKIYQLRDEIESLTEEIDVLYEQLEKKNKKVESFRRELVEAACEVFGCDPRRLISGLRKGFSASELISRVYECSPLIASANGIDFVNKINKANYIEIEEDNKMPRNKKLSALVRKLMGVR